MPAEQLEAKNYPFNMRAAFAKIDNMNVRGEFS
jgi:hypothetical protein